jgi:cell wall-associated NlpC family hydrolase
MIRHAKEDKWTEHTFTTIMEGLMKAARQNLDTEKVGLFMLISVAQKLGTPENIVQDALADAKKRASSRPEKKKVQPIKKPSFSQSTRTSREALNYDTLRRSVESFIGTPYVWGGNTRRGVDCSGFTRLVMYENGYLIPRVSRDQAKAGTPIYKNNLQLGDLVFFDTKGRGRITHVGLYLGGNLLVHASSSKGVTIVLFSGRYFQSRYVTSRRIVRYRGQ